MDGPFHLAAPRAAAGIALFRRRLGFALLSGATALALLWLMEQTLFAAGIDGIGLAMLLLFALTLPWNVVGFWNAAIGVGLMRLAHDPVTAVAPYLRQIRGDESIVTRTAILACVRNEDPVRLARTLETMCGGLVASGAASAFHLYILSDSGDPAIAAMEEKIAASLATRLGAQLGVSYRRRREGAGFKAGNIRDFCERWGDAHDFAIVLDADSLMTAPAMLRLVRILQAKPAIGIVQTLVTGLPAASPFARIFQFGMRLGMRSYTLGAASWQADCGPYWGHNAIIRLQPFIRHCALPVPPGRPPLGGHVLSHDQLEAVLMRRAGYEVRVLPEEGGSWEENPTTLLEFIRRDLRWCQGNMQYWRFLAMPGLRAVSRCQLAMAIAMYLGAPAWLGFMALGFLRRAPFRPDLGILLFVLMMVMSFAPKIATLVDVLARRDLRDAYGGASRFLAGFVIDTLFSTLTSPVVAVAQTIFLAGLPFGRTVGWTAQRRDAHAVPFTAAIAKLWPQTLVGVVFGVAILNLAPGAVWYALPFFLGLVLSVPLAMVSAHPAPGRFLVRGGLCRIPEEASPPPALGALDLPELAAQEPAE